MEIRHRRQWLTGKMIAEVRNESWQPWEDADLRTLEIGMIDHRQNGFEKGYALGQSNSTANDMRAKRNLQEENETLRSQLSETLNMLREYREAEAQAFAAKIVTDAVATIDKTIGNCSGAVAGNALAAGGLFKATHDAIFPTARGEFVIPHHGPGLSEAEDAMREDAWSIDHVGPGLKHPTDEPVQPLQSQTLRLILERVGNTSRIYYRVQERITCINKHQGIADSIKAAIECIPAEDRVRIGEERRYGMEVGK